MTTSRNALAELAHQAVAMTQATIPETVAQQARLCVLDTVGCMLAGSRTEEAALMLACEPDGPGAEGITVVGTSHRRPLQAAIRINGYLGDVLELNDLIGGHASIGNVTAALALAQHTGASGTRTLEAVVRGIEVTARVYGAVYPSLKRYTDAGLVPVGMPSTIGVAATAAHLLDLDEERTLHAMAIAGALAGWCPAEVIFGNGGSVKPMLFGAQPADAGVTAAFYARAGMTGPTALLDSAVGYFATASTEGRFDPDAWSGRWALSQPRRKLHACCGYLHAPVDAIGRLCGAHGAGLQDAQVEVRVAPYVADVVSKDRLPTSPNDARFHLQYCLALALCGADVILPEHSIGLRGQLERADLRAAMGRIRVVPAPELTHYHQCEVRVIDPTGHTFTQSLDTPRGSPQQPLSDDDIQAKFLLLAEPVLGGERSRQFARGALAVEEMADVGEWLSMLGN